MSSPDLFPTYITDFDVDQLGVAGQWTWKWVATAAQHYRQRAVRYRAELKPIVD